MMSMLRVALKFQPQQIAPEQRSGAQFHRKNRAIDYKCLQDQDVSKYGTWIVATQTTLMIPSYNHNGLPSRIRLP
jgi:hypothetical protein